METLQRDKYSRGSSPVSCDANSSSGEWVTTEDDSGSEFEFRRSVDPVATKADTDDTSDYEDEGFMGCGQMIPHPLEDLMPKSQFFGSYGFEETTDMTVNESQAETRVDSFLDGPETLWEEPPVENVLSHPGNGRCAHIDSQQRGADRPQCAIITTMAQGGLSMTRICQPVSRIPLLQPHQNRSLYNYSRRLKAQHRFCRSNVAPMGLATAVPLR